MGEKIRIGLIGLGCRGAMLLEDVFLNHEDAVISAVCDVYEDRCEKAAKLIVSRRVGKEVYYKAADTKEASLLHEMIEKLVEIACPASEKE